MIKKVLMVFEIHKRKGDVEKSKGYLWESMEPNG